MERFQMEIWGAKSHKPQFLLEINNKAKNAVYDTDMIG